MFLFYGHEQVEAKRGVQACKVSLAKAERGAQFCKGEGEGVAEHWVATAAARLVATWAEDLAAQEVEVGMAVALEEATVEVQEVRRVEAAAGLKEWAEVTLETVARVVVRPAVVAEARLVDLAAVTFAPNTLGAAR